MYPQYNELDSPRHSNHNFIFTWPLHTHTQHLLQSYSEISQFLGKVKIHLQMLHQLCLKVDILGKICTVTQPGSYSEPALSEGCGYKDGRHGPPRFLQSRAEIQVWRELRHVKEAVCSQTHVSLADSEVPAFCTTAAAFITPPMCQVPCKALGYTQFLLPTGSMSSGETAK